MTTKVWTTHFAPNDLERSTKESLTKLRLSEVDLLLLHWPNPQVPLAETLGALAHVKKLGMARHIGVSNFTVALIEEAVAACPEPLVCDQVEYHPYLDQTKVREACARHGMAVVAYSPVAKGRIKNDADAGAIGQTHGKTAAQVCLRWLVQQNVSAIPRTSRIERLSENIDIFDFELSDEEMQARSPGWEAPRAGSPISVSRRNGIEAAAPAAMLTAGGGRHPDVDPARWKYGEFIRSDIAASAIAHLSVLAAAASVHRGASVRLGDRRADRGRYRHAGRGRARLRKPKSPFRRSSLRDTLRPVAEIRAFQCTGASAAPQPAAARAAAAGRAVNAASA